MSAARVLVLNSCVSGGGAGRSLAILLEHSDKRVEFSVVMPEKGVIASRLSAAKEIFYVPEFVERIRYSPYLWFDRLHLSWAHPVASIWSLSVAARRIEAIAQDVRPHVIYCNHMLAKPLGVRVGDSLGLPVVFHSRATHHLTVDRLFYSWLGARKCVERIICNSEAAARAYRRRSGDKTIIVPNGIDTSFFSRRVVDPTLRRSHEIPEDAFVVGFVGRLLPKKGVDWLLQSFALFARRTPHAMLAVVGGNDRSLHHDIGEQYRREAERLGLGHRVIFTGFRDDVRVLMADFDVLVFPSRLPESFGRVLIEAMALEIPVITSAQGGSTEVVRNGVDGLWVQIDDRVGLAKALARLEADPALRSEMGRRGRERAVEVYDSRRVNERIVNVLLETAAFSRRRVLLPEREIADLSSALPR